LSAIITLTTDFGTRDAYVAEMKGVMLEIAAAAGRPVHLVDVTHEVERHDVTEAALALDAAAPHFPPGTVHLAVVDPGVGTDRRELVVQTERAVFVGPDNGVFTPFLDGSTAWRAWELRAPEYRLPSVSRTFHGRDIFSPVAAHLAGGVDLGKLGPALDPAGLERLEVPQPSIGETRIRATVLYIDRFGNVQLNVRADQLAQVGIEPGARVEVEAGFERYFASAARTFADARIGDIVLYEDAYANIALAINRGDAARMFSVRVGDELRLTSA